MNQQEFILTGKVTSTQQKLLSWKIFFKRNNDCTPFPKGVFATEQSGVDLWLVYFGGNNCVEADEWDIFVAPEKVLGPLPKLLSTLHPEDSFHNWSVIYAPPGFSVHGTKTNHLPHFIQAHMSRRFGREEEEVRVAAW